MDQRCEECGSKVRSGLERGWRIVHAGDPETDEVTPAWYCPVCARRELDDSGPEGEDSPIIGGAPGVGSSRMDFSVEFDRSSGDVLVTTAGIANSDGFLRLNRALAADARFRPGVNILVDHTALDTRELTEDDLHEITGSFAAIRSRLGTSRLAFVISDRTAARQIDDIRANAQPLEAQSQEFYSRSDAMAWLHPTAPDEQTAKQK
jgi:hypothetical protein